MTELQHWASARYALNMLYGEAVGFADVGSLCITSTGTTSANLTVTATMNATGNTLWSPVIPTQGLSQWQVQGIKRLNVVLDLPENWDSYGSPPPTQEAANAAMAILTGIAMDYFVTPRVVPVSGGGLQLEWEIGTRRLEFEILDDGSVEHLRIEREEPFEEGLVKSLNDVRPLFLWLLSSDTIQRAA